MHLLPLQQHQAKSPKAFLGSSWRSPLARASVALRHVAAIFQGRGKPLWLRWGWMNSVRNVCWVNQTVVPATRGEPVLHQAGAEAPGAG